VVAAKVGDAAIKDKPQAYIDARFDILAEEVSKSLDADPFRRVVANGVQAAVGDADAADKALRQSITDLNAWRDRKEA
jgi:hypothetical protein